MTLAYSGHRRHRKRGTPRRTAAPWTPDVPVTGAHSRGRPPSGDFSEFVVGDSLATGRWCPMPPCAAWRRPARSSGSAKGDEHKATLCPAARRPEISTSLLSVVGAERCCPSSPHYRAMFGYYFAAKLAAERVTADSGLPWTTPRASHSIPDPDLDAPDCQAPRDPVPDPASLPAGRGRRGGARARGSLCPAEPAGWYRPGGATGCTLCSTSWCRCNLACPGRAGRSVPVRLGSKRRTYRRFRCRRQPRPRSAGGHRTWEDF